jgi:hypothetical protein
MRLLRPLFFVCFVVFANCAFAKDVYLSIGGSVGVFHTDTRIFNPSTTKDIQIQAYLLPPSADNSGVQPITITIPKRQMVSYNDVVQSLFNNTSVNLAAIRLKSDDDFVATQRIYAQTTANACSSAGTLGQFVPGFDVSVALKQGVLIQLKSTPSAFRTNIGLVNPNAAAANVTWRLYDKNNAVVGTVNTGAMPATIQPFGVITPVNLTSVFNAPGADLSDAWVSFSSDQPIFAYGSVVDSATTDPTFITMSPDSGVISQQPTGKTYNVTEQNFSITISPAIGPNDLKPSDEVTFHITVKDSSHGLQLNDPDGRALIPFVIFSPGQVVDKTFTITKTGTYSYFCVNSSCGTGHSSMTGEFIVGSASEPPPPRY